MSVCAITRRVEPRFNVPRVGDGRGRRHTSVAVLLSLSCRCSTPALTLMRIFDRRSCLCRTLSSLATLFDSSSSWSSTICRARRRPQGTQSTAVVRRVSLGLGLATERPFATQCCRGASGDKVIIFIRRQRVHDTFLLGFEVGNHALPCRGSFLDFGAYSGASLLSILHRNATSSRPINAKQESKRAVDMVAFDNDRSCYRPNRRYALVLVTFRRCPSPGPEYFTSSTAALRDDLRLFNPSILAWVRKTSQPVKRPRTLRYFGTVRNAILNPCLAW